MLSNVFTSSRVLLWVVGALLVLSMALGVAFYVRGKTVDSQKTTIEAQKEQISQFQGDVKARDKASAQLQKDKTALAAELNRTRKSLKDALKDNECANTALPDDVNRVLDEIYSR